MSEKGKVLVACPTYAGKEYALQSWIDGFNALTYPDKYAYQVDNTMQGLQYFETLKSKGIKCSHVVPWTNSDMETTFHRCWELILEEALREDVYWIYSVEADNVPAPNSLEIMINIALYGNLHLVTHSYPMHQTAVKASGMNGDEFFYDELGCMLLSRCLLERALFIYPNFRNIAASIFAAAEKFRGGWCKLTKTFEVKHLDGYEMEYPQFATPSVEGWCPTPKVPDDYATVLPPSLQNHS